MARGGGRQSRGVPNGGDGPGSLRGLKQLESTVRAIEERERERCTQGAFEVYKHLPEAFVEK